MASSGWYAGVVKEVQSGDTLVVSGQARGPTGVAAERRISLVSLSAPRMVRPWVLLCFNAQCGLILRAVLPRALLDLEG